MRKIFIAGNWKMNNNVHETQAFFEEFNGLLKNEDFSNIEIGIGPSFVCLERAKNIADKNVKILAQNVYFEEKGAFTGEVSADMLKSLEIDYVIIGHSERRKYFGDTDEIVNKKIKKAFEKNLKVILCVGEKLQEREQGITEIVVEKQLRKDLEGLDKESLKNLVIAYEPIWAIGTGKNAKAEDAEAVCKFIRKIIKDMFGEESANAIRIQYGGSVKPENAAEYMKMENIDGALVGGASLKAKSFFEILKNVKSIL